MGYKVPGHSGDGSGAGFEEEKDFIAWICPSRVTTLTSSVQNPQLCGISQGTPETTVSPVGHHPNSLLSQRTPPYRSCRAHSFCGQSSIPKNVPAVGLCSAASAIRRSGKSYLKEEAGRATLALRSSSLPGFPDWDLLCPSVPG